MTHEERARGIVTAFCKHEYWLDTDALVALRDLIATGMAEASNDELARRRAVEAERDRLRRIVESMAVAVKPCAACGKRLYFVRVPNAIGLAALEDDWSDHMSSDCGKTFSANCCSGMLGEALCQCWRCREKRGLERLDKAAEAAWREEMEPKLRAWQRKVGA